MKRREFVSKCGQLGMGLAGLAAVASCSRAVSRLVSHLARCPALLIAVPLLCAFGRYLEGVAGGIPLNGCTQCRDDRPG